MTNNGTAKEMVEGRSGGNSASLPDIKPRTKISSLRPAVDACRPSPNRLAQLGLTALT